MTEMVQHVSYLCISQHVHVAAPPMSNALPVTKHREECCKHVIMDNTPKHGSGTPMMSSVDQQKSQGGALWSETHVIPVNDVVTWSHLMAN